MVYRTHKKMTLIYFLVIGVENKMFKKAEFISTKKYPIYSIRSFDLYV